MSPSDLKLYFDEDIKQVFEAYQKREKDWPLKEGSSAQIDWRLLWDSFIFRQERMRGTQIVSNPSSFTPKSAISEARRKNDPS